MTANDSQSTHTNGAPFQLTRREETGGLNRTESLAELMQAGNVADECWLFVGPHDDDICIGGGLLIQAAVEAGVDVQNVIVTDGRQGYCRKEDSDRIVQLRRDETLGSFEILEIPAASVVNLGFPDGGLTMYSGRRPSVAGESGIAGAVGLQNSFTKILRDLRPARVFVPTPTDLHPDHRITHSELMISLFHASGAIWPELGEPLKEVPRVYEMAVYCDFAEPPTLEVIADEPHFQNKLNSVAAYESQVQIASLVESLRRAGPYEYFREVTFRLYCAETYKPLFRD